LYWLIVIAVFAYLLWRYWEQVVAALQNFLQSWRDFWARLFGGGAAQQQLADAAAELPAAPPRPFADYVDPFTSGQASRWPAEELIRYSFAAFEAWARERGYPRSAEQTPSEFVQVVAAGETYLAREALQLGELYNVSAYGRKATTSMNVAPVQRLWQRLRGVEG
jgi:hypothetical protein